MSPSSSPERRSPACRFWAGLVESRGRAGGSISEEVSVPDSTVLSADDLLFSAALSDVSKAAIFEERVRPLREEGCNTLAGDFADLDRALLSEGTEALAGCGESLCLYGDKDFILEDDLVFSGVLVDLEEAEEEEQEEAVLLVDLVDICLAGVEPSGL